MRTLNAAWASAALLVLAGCGSSAPAAVTSQSPSTARPATSEAAKQTPVPAADTALRSAVQAYSDAYLSGDGKQAYNLLSNRCRLRHTLGEFSYLVSQAKLLYGNPIPLKTFKAHISDDMARVTYTYSISGINQTDQPWIRESSGWHDDNC